MIFKSRAKFKAETVKFAKEKEEKEKAKAIEMGTTVAAVDNTNNQT